MEHLAKTISIVFLYIIAICNCYLFSQQETLNWSIGQDVNMNFSSGFPTHSYNLNCYIWESSASISDENGNLLFYSDGDTVKGNNNEILPNGSNLTSGIQYAASTVTQGSIFLKKPNSDNEYFLFSMAIMNTFNMNLSYSIIDKNLNNGVGEVVSKNNLLIHDSLTEKMTITKHCNNKDYWLVVINKKMLTQEESKLGKYDSEFLSYLITENGIQFSPQKSLTKIAVPQYGQMKFNSDGTVLACADAQGIYFFDFDKSNGTVTFRQKLSVPLGNGYGFEFSPNDRILYINEKQYDIETNTLTPLINFNSPGQWQRASNGKLYKLHTPYSEIDTTINNSWVASGNSNNSLRVTQVSQPNIQGIGCVFDTNFIYEFHNNYNGWSIALPHFPSYHFYHPSGEFSYTGRCIGELFQFQLSNNPVVPIDSVHWIFGDGTVESGITASHIFNQSGSLQVSTVTFSGGFSDTISQCITVCGNSDFSMPSVINLCEIDALEINAINPCSYKYLWNTGDTTSSIMINEEGIYILETTSSCGISYDTLIVVKQGCPILSEIPNVFTPNADGANDVFSINLKNVASFHYQIFNRWGNLIKDSNVNVIPSIAFNWNTFPLWNGELEGGKDTNEGVYFYLIKMETITGEQDDKHGFIHLLR